MSETKNVFSKALERRGSDLQDRFEKEVETAIDEVLKRWNVHHSRVPSATLQVGHYDYRGTGVLVTFGTNDEQKKRFSEYFQERALKDFEANMEGIAWAFQNQGAG